MKYVIIIPDGAADEPIPALGNKTILESANIPCLNKLAGQGQIGVAHNVPSNLPAGSDVANLSVLGFNPSLYYTGRAPLEAAALGLKLGPNDWVVRCNMTTVIDQYMRSFSAGHISSEEQKELLTALQDAVVGDYPPGAMEFISGVGYRGLLILREVPGFTVPLSQNTRTFAPHDYTDQRVWHVGPQGAGGELLLELMDKSIDVFANHPVNKKRIEQGKVPATNVWLWGQGQMPVIPSFKETYGKTGAMITAVDLLRGIANSIGFDNIIVPGATGFIDTNFSGKAAAALDALKTHDVVCIHLEATDESGHEGSVEHKVQAMEDIDAKVVAPIWDALSSSGEPFRMFVTPDHPTPIRTKTHSYDVVPWLMVGTGVPACGATSYNEKTALAAGQYREEGWKLVGELLS